MQHGSGKILTRKLDSLDMHTRSVLQKFFCSHEGRSMTLCIDEVAAAIGAIRRTYRRNYDGACVFIFALLFAAQPERFTRWFSTALASYSKMDASHVLGLAFGKLKSLLLSTTCV